MALYFAGSFAFRDISDNDVPFYPIGVFTSISIFEDCFKDLCRKAVLKNNIQIKNFDNFYKENLEISSDKDCGNRLPIKDYILYKFTYNEADDGIDFIDAIIFPIKHDNLMTMNTDNGAEPFIYI